MRIEIGIKLSNLEMIHHKEDIRVDAGRTRKKLQQ